MKTLKLKLKKKVLIIDAEKCGYISDTSLVILDGTIYNIPEDYEFLCKGSELTGEIASELMIQDGNCNFRDIRFKEYMYEFSKEAFTTSIEISGFHWLENPYGNLVNVNPDIPNSMVRIVNRVKYIDQWKEAEEKTFRNPLIFVKK